MTEDFVVSFLFKTPQIRVTENQRENLYLQLSRAPVNITKSTVMFGAQFVGGDYYNSHHKWIRHVLTDAVHL